MSRRDFLTAGAVVAGVLATGQILSNKGVDVLSKAFAGESAPAWPWPYKKLDPEVVRKLGYQGYFEGGCCYGAAKAMLTELRNKVGYPYTLIPEDMFRYGEGGMAGWGTICGALNGASAIINLVSTKESWNPLVNELLGWYTQQPFPSRLHDSYSKFPNQVQSVCGSPLCHVSVTEWCAKAGVKVGDPQRKERCGKLTGDVAARAVELLNLQADGKFVPAYKPSEEFASCLGCHVGPQSTLFNVQGKMNCVQCHEPHIK
ncbi:MAG: C-GCAxxG-C-C family (seleno)protein [Bacillota bacterium]|nr:C-GCAxxG-C-C family (seleno)protein [Bacillota bacterium]